MRRFWGYAGWLVAAGAIAACLLSIMQLRSVYSSGKLAMTRLAPDVVLPADWVTARQRVLIVGDSRIAQWQPRPVLDGTSFAFSGLGAETLAQLSQRFSRTALSLDPPPDKIVLASGINDLVAASLNPSAAAAISQVLPKHAVTLSDAARAANIDMVFMTVIRPAQPGIRRRLVAWSDALPGMVDAYNSELRKIGDVRRLQIIEADSALAPTDGPLPKQYARDALHFTPTAYRALNQILQTAFGE